MTPTPHIRAMASEALEKSEKATKGPWTHVIDGIDSCVLSETMRAGPEPDDRVIVCSVMQAFSSNKADGDFIAHARTSLPLLARALLAAIDCIDKLRSEDLGADDAYIRDFDAALSRVDDGGM